MALETVRFQSGETPVLLALTHAGLALPDDLAPRMTEAGRVQPDAERHLDRLFHFAPALGLGWIAATASRHVVDVNRAPDDVDRPVCPTLTFEGAPIYAGDGPDDGEIARRRVQWWDPFHARLGDAIADLRARFGVAVLIDAHSINGSVMARLGRPVTDLSLNIDRGRSCDPQLAWRIRGVFDSADGLEATTDQDGDGHYLGRHYGDPAGGVHVVQLDIRQTTFMDEDAPWAFDPLRAAMLQPVLERALSAVIDWAWSRASGRRRASVF